MLTILFIAASLSAIIVGLIVTSASYHIEDYNESIQQHHYGTITYTVGFLGLMISLALFVGGL
jgi:hypothetical protein